MMQDRQQRIVFHRATANATLQEWLGHLPDDCEMRKLASIAFAQATEYFVDEDYATFEYRDFDGVMRATQDFLAELRGVLNPINSSLVEPNGGTGLYKKDFYEKRIPSFEKDNNPESWLSFLDRSANESFFLVLLEKEKESGLFWPLGSLDYSISRYLRMPWVQCAEIDRLLVGAMIYERTLEQINTLTVWSLNRYTEAYKKRERNTNIVGGIIYLAAAIVGIGAAIAFGWWAGLIAALGTFVLIGKCDDEFNKDSRRWKFDALRLFDSLQRVFFLAQKRGTSALFLREQLAALNGSEGNILKPQIFSIVDNARARGVVLWGFEGPK